MARRFRIPLLAVGFVVAAAGGVYAWWWHHVAAEIERGLPQVIGPLRAEGIAVDYARLQVAGFPLEFRLDFAQPAVARRGMAPDLTWRGDRLVAAARPWRLAEWALTVDRPSHVAAEMGAERWAGTVARADGTLRFGAAGGDVMMTARDVVGSDADPLRISELRLRLAPDPGRTNATAIAVAAERMTLPARAGTALGRDVEALSAEGTLVERVPRGPVAASLEAWRAAGGIVDVHRLSLRWGPLQATGNATLALDRELQPLLAGTAVAKGYGEVVERLAATGVLGWREAMATRIVLAALAVPSGDGGGSELRLQFAVQDGQLTAGAVGGQPRRLVAVPRIRWPE
ncbi:MAG: DUF2125 domain-containing protein [Alphaproteobacteria bacterium]